MKLKNKVAIVTGGSGGIGQGLCERLAKEGAKIVINYRSSKEEADAVWLANELLLPNNESGLLEQ